VRCPSTLRPCPSTRSRRQRSGRRAMPVRCTACCRGRCYLDPRARLAVRTLLDDVERGLDVHAKRAVIDREHTHTREANETFEHDGCTVCGHRSPDRGVVLDTRILAGLLCCSADTTPLISKAPATRHRACARAAAHAVSRLHAATSMPTRAWPSRVRPIAPSFDRPTAVRDNRHVGRIDLAANREEAISDG
jgi:hypothetical protein